MQVVIVIINQTGGEEIIGFIMGTRKDNKNLKRKVIYNIDLIILSYLSLWSHRNTGWDHSLGLSTCVQKKKCQTMKTTDVKLR